MRAYLTSLGIHLALLALFLGWLHYEPAPIESIPIDVSLFQKALRAEASRPKGIKKSERTTTATPTKAPAPDSFSANGKAIVTPSSEGGDPNGEPLAEEYDVASMPVLLNEVRIPYPPTAKLKNIQGAVTFDLIIGSNGTVTRAEVISSPDSILTEAARAAVMKFKFRPALYGDKSVAIKIRYLYRFILQ